jgi:hypothetical protein
MSYITGTTPELIYVNTTSGSAKASFTTEVPINDVAGMGAICELPPYFFQPPYGIGKVLRVVARGILGSNGTPNYTFSLRMGAKGSTTAAIVLGSGALTTGSGVSAQLWEFEGDITMRIIGDAGAASTVQGLGLIHCGGLASPFAYPLFGGAASPGTVATVDASITNYLNFNVACSASHASNSVTLLSLQLWGLN